MFIAIISCKLYIEGFLIIIPIHFLKLSIYYDINCNDLHSIKLIKETSKYMNVNY